MPILDSDVYSNVSSTRSTILCISTLAVTTQPISSVCSKCGTVKKSGKLSCCARGGAWFGKCGSADHVKHGHAWHEGIETCKARQSETVVDQELPASQAKRNSSSDNANDIDSEGYVTTTHKLASTPAKMSTAATVNASTSIVALDCTYAVYDPGTTTSTTMKQIRVSELSPKPIIYLVNETVNLPANKASSHPTDIITSHRTIQTIINLMCSGWTNMLRMTPSYSSARRSITERECGGLLEVVTHVSTMMMIVY